MSEIEEKEIKNDIKEEEIKIKEENNKDNKEKELFISNQEKKDSFNKLFSLQQLILNQAGLKDLCKQKKNYNLYKKLII